MGLRKEIKRAAKLEMRKLEKQAKSSPLNNADTERWHYLSNLLESYRNTK